MAESMWMVRAGRDGHLIDEFKRGFIAIGWHELGDLSSISSQDELRERYERTYPDEKPVHKVGGAVGVIYKFCCVLEVGAQRWSLTITQTREYMIGTIEGDYYYSTDEIDHRNLRLCTFSTG